MIGTTSLRTMWGAAMALTISTHLVQPVQGSLGQTANEVIIYSLEKDGSEVPLLEVLEDLPRYFESARQDDDSVADFPASFYFPESFSYEMTYGMVTLANNKKQTIFDGTQKVVFDAENNRVRIERETKVFEETDTVVKVYDFDKMRLLVSDPVKKMCLQQKIQDISPVSMVPREHDQIVIADAIQSLWVHPTTSSQKSDINDEDSDWLQDKNDTLRAPAEAKTSYFGEHVVTLRNTGKTLLDKEHYHIFMNNYSFLDLETKYAQLGGADGASTLYLFREIQASFEEDDSSQDSSTIWELAGVVSKYRNQKPDVYCNLGSSFTPLDAQSIKTNEFQLKFYQRECHQYLDEYMLIEGNQLVKRVATNAVLQ